MTVTKPFVNPLSCENPLGIRKSTAHDAHDGDDDELQRFSKGVAAPYFEMIDAVMGWKYRSTSEEHKRDKQRCPCEVSTLYSSPNTSSATLIDGARHPVWVLAAGTSRKLASFDGRAFVQELLRCSFLHAILDLQSSETRHPQSPLATILLRSGRSSRSAPRW